MSRKKARQTPKRVLRLPDLDFREERCFKYPSTVRVKASYRFAIEDFVAWYCSEPRWHSTRPLFSGIGSSWNPGDCLPVQLTNENITPYKND
jgi:hypothetical protein